MGASARAISIRKGLSGLLIFEAAVIAAVTVGFMAMLYRTYTQAMYSESEEVLNLYAVVAEARLADIEALSFEFLSNPDVQANLQKYVDFPGTLEAYQAASDLYTQLFTRWILTDGVLSITFRFLDGTRVDAGNRQAAWLSDAALEELAAAAAQLSGSPSWAVNVAGENTATLYRLIRDVSGRERFRPLGALFINVDAEHILHHTPALSKKYEPQILAIAGDEVLARNGVQLDPGEVLRSVSGTGTGTLQASGRIVWLDREPHLLAVKELRGAGWSLVYLLSTRALLEDIFQLNLLYGAALLAVVTCVVALGYAFASRIHKPVEQLTEAMKAVERGEYARALKEGPKEPRLAFAEVTQLARGFAHMVKEIDRLITEVYERQLTIMEMRYRTLRQQINPHFLYNTLDTIHWKATEGGHPEISVMVKALARLLRGAIKGPDVVTVGEELRFVEEYLTIQKIRFEERLEVEIQIPEEVHGCLIPHLTLQPLVENSIVHNLERFAEPLKVSLTAAVIESKLELRVADTGRGADLERVRRVLSGELEAGERSIGLRNIDQRIKMSFGEAYGIRVENRPSGGAVVTVSLPWAGAGKPTAGEASGEPAVEGAGAEGKTGAKGAAGKEVAREGA